MGEIMTRTREAALP